MAERFVVLVEADSYLVARFERGVELSTDAAVDTDLLVCQQGFYGSSALSFQGGQQKFEQGRRLDNFKIAVCKRFHVVEKMYL